MSHYFIKDDNLKDDIKEIIYYFGEHKLTFKTNAGLFSKDHVDPATDILLRTIPNINGKLLDLGCGYGCIGIVLSKVNDVELTQVDVNQSALDFTKINCELNNVESKFILSNCFDNVTNSFDTITLNPPIHAGKSVTYKMYEESFSHLNEGGKLFIVTLKKHGAESTQAKLKEIFGNCETLYKKKGYFVFCSVK